MASPYASPYSNLYRRFASPYSNPYVNPYAASAAPGLPVSGQYVTQDQLRALLEQFPGEEDVKPKGGGFPNPLRFVGKLVPDIVERGLGQVAESLVMALPGLGYAIAQPIMDQAVFAKSLLEGDPDLGALTFERTRNLGEMMGRGLYEDFRHPLRNIGYLSLDLLGGYGMVAGTSARAGRAGAAAQRMRTGRVVDDAARAGDDLPPEALARLAQLTDEEAAALAAAREAPSNALRDAQMAEREKLEARRAEPPPMEHSGVGFGVVPGAGYPGPLQIPGLPGPMLPEVGKALELRPSSALERLTTSADRLLQAHLFTRTPGSLPELAGGVQRLELPRGRPTLLPQGDQPKLLPPAPVAKFDDPALAEAVKNLPSATPNLLAPFHDRPYTYEQAKTVARETGADMITRQLGTSRIRALLRQLGYPESVLGKAVEDLDAGVRAELGEGGVKWLPEILSGPVSQAKKAERAEKLKQEFGEAEGSRVANLLDRITAYEVDVQALRQSFGQGHKPGHFLAKPDYEGGVAQTVRLTRLGSDSGVSVQHVGRSREGKGLYRVHDNDAPVGPLFSSASEALTAAREWAADKLNGVPRELRDLEHGGGAVYRIGKESSLKEMGREFVNLEDAKSLAAVDAARATLKSRTASKKGRDAAQAVIKEWEARKLERTGTRDVEAQRVLDQAAARQVEHEALLREQKIAERLKREHERLRSPTLSEAARREAQAFIDEHDPSSRARRLADDLRAESSPGAPEGVPVGVSRDVTPEDWNAVARTLSPEDSAALKAIEEFVQADPTRQQRATGAELAKELLTGPLAPGSTPDPATLARLAGGELGEDVARLARSVERGKAAGRSTAKAEARLREKLWGLHEEMRALATEGMSTASAGRAGVDVAVRELKRLRERFYPTPAAAKAVVEAADEPAAAAAAAKPKPPRLTPEQKRQKALREQGFEEVPVDSLRSGDRVIIGGKEAVISNISADKTRVRATFTEERVNRVVDVSGRKDEMGREATPTILRAFGEERVNYNPRLRDVRKAAPDRPESELRHMALAARTAMERRVAAGETPTPEMLRAEAIAAGMTPAEAELLAAGTKQSAALQIIPGSLRKRLETAGLDAEDVARYGESIKQLWREAKEKGEPHPSRESLIRALSPLDEKYGRHTARDLFNTMFRERPGAMAMFAIPTVGAMVSLLSGGADFGMAAVAGAGARAATRGAPGITLREGPATFGDVAAAWLKGFTSPRDAPSPSLLYRVTEEGEPMIQRGKAALVPRSLNAPTAALQQWWRGFLQEAAHDVQTGNIAQGMQGRVQATANAMWERKLKHFSKMQERLMADNVLRLHEAEWQLTLHTQIARLSEMYKDSPEKMEEVLKAFKEQLGPSPMQAREAVRAEAGKHVSFLGRLFDTANQLASLNLLMLKPGYVPPNFIGQLLFTSIDHFMNPFAMSRTRSLLLDAAKLDPEIPAMMQELMHVGSVGALKQERGFSRRVQNLQEGLADFWSKAIDDPAILPFRSMALVNALYHRGYRSADDLVKVLRATPEDGARYLDLTVATMDANRNIIDYGNMGPRERRHLRRLILFYPWVKGATVYAGRYLSDHPIQAMLGQLEGRVAQEEFEKTLGPLPSFLEGSIPMPKALDKVPVLSTLLGGATRTIEGIGEVPRLYNPTAVSVLGTGGDALQMARSLLFGDVRAADRPASLLNPLAGAIAAGAFRVDPFIGAAYPQEMSGLDIGLQELQQTMLFPQQVGSFIGGLTGRTPGEAAKGLLESSAVLGGKIPGLPDVAKTVVDTLLPPSKAQRLAQGEFEEKDTLLPVTRQEEIGRYLTGMFPQTYNPAVGRSRALAERAQNPVQAEQSRWSEKVRTATIAAEQAGVIKSGERLPPDLVGAVTAKARRVVNYAKYAEANGVSAGDMSQYHKLRADLDLLVEMKEMTRADAEKTFREYLGLDEGTVRSFRRKLGDFYFGQSVISSYTSYYKAANNLELDFSM